MSTDSLNPIRAAMLAQKKTQADVAAALGVSRQAVQKWCTGTPPTLSNLKRLAQYLGTTVAALAGDEEPQYQPVDSFTEVHGEGWTVVPVVDAYGGCSIIGAFAQTGEIIGAVEFSDAFLSASPGVVGGLSKDRFCLVSPTGDSMEPTIGKYDHCLVDKRQCEIRGDGIYWIQIEGTYFLKRVAVHFDRSITLISDNPRYPPQTVPRDVVDTACVIGRVIRTLGIKDA